MKIVNIHRREYSQPIEVLSELLDTLSSNNDQIWPKENWPPMILSEGLKVNSTGGHGPIGYCVTKYQRGRLVEFKFTKPRDYIGTHKFEIIPIAANRVELIHTINMNVNIHGAATWYFATKWLHDALLEDCLDKVQNQFNRNDVKRCTRY